MNYFQKRQMKVKWHGKISESRNLPGGGAMGATFGILEFLSQTNNNIDCVPEEDRFKWVDDVSILEIISMIINIVHLITKPSVPSDLPNHGQWIPAENLKSQNYLTEINKWTKNQQMALNPSKLKNL